MIADVETPYVGKFWLQRTTFAWRAEVNHDGTKQICYMPGELFLVPKDGAPIEFLRAVCDAHNIAMEASMSHNAQFRKRTERILEVWRPLLLRRAWWRVRDCAIFTYDDTVEIADNLRELRKLLQQPEGFIE